MDRALVLTTDSNLAPSNIMWRQCDIWIQNCTKTPKLFLASIGETELFPDNCLKFSDRLFEI